MENILQSLVKIIIVGVLYGKTNVDCNRQFLPPPPLPYYQNDNYYLPAYSPSFPEQPPTYYPQRNLPNPTSFQNIKSYTPPRLFYQNDNYIPPPIATPGIGYPLPQITPYKQPLQQPQQPHKPQPKPSFTFSRVQYKSTPQAQPPRPQRVSQKKTEAFASNIIVKEEPLSPYYTDDDGKNYHDEDYIDSYTDDSPALPKPCISNDPYRYFETPKGNDNKYSLCNPYFQPNFGSSVYTLKVPITLLPSRFPPRVEQLIERIQNYFSTYTQQETSKPQNETLPLSTTPAAVEASTDSSAQSSTAAEVHENNMAVETQPETVSTTAAVEITNRTIVVAAETKDSLTQTTAASPPDAKVISEPQAATQKIQKVEEVTERMAEEVAIVTEKTPEEPVANITPAGEEKPHIPPPEEPQSANTSFTIPAEDVKMGNQYGGDGQIHSSFQPSVSNSA